jgi:hypothetical protein
MNSLFALEEGVTGLSGTWTPGGVGQSWAPVGSEEAWGGSMPNPNNPTIAIGPAFGTQLARGGGVEAISPPQSQGPMPSSALPVSSAPAAMPYQPSPSGPDWTPQPGMLYAAGQAYSPQDYINRFGYATYLSVAGGGAAAAAAPSTAPAALPPAPTSAPSGAPVAISSVGLPMPAQTAGQGVSVSAPTLDFSSYFSTKPPRLPPARHFPNRPLRGLGQTTVDLEEGMLVNLAMLAGLFWFIGVAYKVKKR